jgi:excisionase family DNA binding protein
MTDRTSAGNFDEREAAQRIGVSRITLLRARKRGEIGYYRVGSRVIYSEAHIRAILDDAERTSRS